MVMTLFRTLLMAGAAAALFATGCQNAEQVGRYVKAPFETGDLTTRPAIDQALNDARTRLLSVRDEELRAELSKEIDQTYDRMMLPIREEEQAEAARKELEAAKEREAERQRAAVRDRAAQRRAAVAEAAERNKDVVTRLEVGLRDSLLGDGTKVLVLRNAEQAQASFQLRCHTRGDVSQRTFSVTVPPGREKHLGFLQGWCGNFKGGERCEAYVDGERLWEYKVPAQ